MKKLILGLVVILVAVVIILRIFNTRLNQKPAITPTPTLAQPSISQTIYPSPYVFDQKFSSNLDVLKNASPYDSRDFKFIYSPLLNLYVIGKKNPGAETVISTWLQTFGITNLGDYQNIIIITDTSPETYIGQKEQLLEQNMNKIRETTPSGQVQGLSDDDNSRQINFIIKILRLIFRIGSTPVSTEELQDAIDTENPNPVTPGQTPPGFTAPPLSLTQVFDEVGERVGVPPKILEGVLRIENPSTFSLSESNIAQYSVPGNTIPGCKPNACSAIGPMQMTIGYDGTGNTHCPNCGGFCPNAWASYGRAVNTYGTYGHTSNPCNLRDNIYGAAAKLKHDSRATDPLNWTEEQVKRAARSYYGSCSDSYRYIRLAYPGNPKPTYCEFLWWYYQNSTGTPSTPEATKPPGSFVYYPQCGGKYGNYPLPGGCTLCRAGCGPTSVSMILSSYIDSKYTPPYTLQLYQRSGAYINCSGSSMSGGMTVLRREGVRMSDAMYYRSSSINKVAADFRNYLKHGWTLLVVARFPAGGHFFWAVDIDENNNLWAYDPYYGRFQAPPFNENQYYPHPYYVAAVAVRPN